jgi:hypothetical protein
MSAPVSTPSGTALSRFKERLLHPWSQSGHEAANQPPAHLPVILPQRAVGFPASIAEFLLVFRLRARRRRAALSADMLERAVRMVLVTCQHWFGASDLHQQGARRRHD